MTNNHIEFVYTGDDEPDESIHPVSGSEVIPEWFRKTPTIFNRGSTTRTTVKLCRAFSDALDLGFIIPAPDDITIDRFADFSIQSDSDDVHVYGPTPYRENGNSTYPLPEVKIDIPWEIHTPDGYSAFITQPLNRDVKGFKPNSMLVPTDQYTGPISIPAVMGPRTHQMQKGDPLVSVIPLKREEILQHANWTHEEKPELSERANRIRKQLTTRKDLYRTIYHQQKPRGETVYAENADNADNTDIQPLHTQSKSSSNDVDAFKNMGDRSETHDEYLFFLTDEQDMGVVPGPYDPLEKAPPWLGELTTRLNTDGLEDTTQEENFDVWMKAACSMGGMDVVPSDVDVHQEPKYENREARSRFDEAIISHSIDEKIGPEFPLDMNITGIASDRYIGSADGYSTLVTSPLNHYSQFIRGFHGVVDHDLYIDVTNVPSMIYTEKPNFTIEKGSPHLQGIPFRRDSIIDTAVITL